MAKVPSPDVRSRFVLVVDFEVLAPAAGNRSERSIALLRHALDQDWNIVQRPPAHDAEFDGYLDMLLEGGFFLLYQRG